MENQTLKPELFFPVDQNGKVIIPPCILNCHNEGKDYKKEVEEYKKLPTIYKAKNHFHTSNYLQCTIGVVFSLVFFKSGDIKVISNFKPDAKVLTIQDLIDYGVNLHRID